MVNVRFYLVSIEIIWRGDTLGSSIMGIKIKNQGILQARLAILSYS